MNEQLTEIYSYLHGMWRYRWPALLVAWSLALIGWIYVIAMPNQYNAKAVIYIDTSSIMKPLLKGLAPETDSFDEIKVMSRVLLSRDNLLSVIRETDMDLEVDSPEAREKLVEHLARTIELKGGGSENKWESRSNIYEISYQATSAERVYHVVSKLLNTMIEGTLNSTRTDTITVQKFLDTQITEHEQRLTQAEQQLAEFKKANIGYMPDEKGGYYARLQRKQEALESTRSALRLAERRRTELNKQLKGENPILDRENYESSTAIKIHQYQEQLNSLLNKFTEQHPDVQALRSVITDLETNKNIEGSAEPVSGTGDSTEFNPVYQEMRAELSKAGVEVETLKIQLADYERQVKKLTDSIDVIPEVEAKLSKLNRDYEVTHERYLDLVERKESAKLAQSADQSASDVSFRVIEPPIVPIRASGPKRVLLITVVLLAALAAGMGWSFLQYQLQPTYINLHQTRLGTGLPVLGSVSLYLTPEHKKNRKKQLATFLSATILLLFVYSGTILYSISA
ncbi:MAG: Wzz/FepE/Etk N-terminal domain-containing protein [Gammaproteobacteria bacterium]|nr:Wzz/FepE/Etk N-terminal domain-containing protein [Gammaproteobacteria bacterium]